MDPRSLGDRFQATKEQHGFLHSQLGLWPVGTGPTPWDSGPQAVCLQAEPPGLSVK